MKSGNRKRERMLKKLHFVWQSYLIVVQLEKDIKKKDQALESSQKKSKSLEQRVQQKDQALQQHQQTLQQKDQALQDARLANQQKDRMLDHKDRLLQQMRQRMREELEQDELQKHMSKMEEENQCLSQRLMCKICKVVEVEVLLSPCKHVVCCQGCVPSLPQNECPICRETIKETVNMYFAWVLTHC